MLSAEDVEKILEETQEAAEYQQEITNLLSGKLSENDLEEVELELESIIEQELSKELDHLPEVPSEEPVAADDKEQLKDDAVANNKQQKMRSDRAEKVMVEAS
ncbi:unnamed protein product [Anisakis simplex]|uniref:Charged multivesicular body protein 6 n=1 Tax=Anisakis simplex TaxID=6269 RepID=A0A0M3KDI5_ANISI|nr:unnamed protein product [Anisakis simplex]